MPPSTSKKRRFDNHQEGAGEPHLVESPTKVSKLNIGKVEHAIELSWKQHLITPPVETPVNHPSGREDLPTKNGSNIRSRRAKRRSRARRKLLRKNVQQQQQQQQQQHDGTLQKTETGLEVVEIPPVRRRLAFARHFARTEYQQNVKHVYRIIKKLTGSIGGNGSFGAIYGELTVGSMQRMVNLMKEHTGLDETSRFIDVGSGLGKPNLHVAQDPGVEFSYGIEMEHSRWLLSVANLKRVLEEAKVQPGETERSARIGHRCIFAHNDVKHAYTFDPFTHVYMFSIGFPPRLWVKLSEIFNRSKSPYLICFHSPRTIIKEYEFEVELITQTQTSMHASGEGHTGYLYKRVGTAHEDNCNRCDPLFQEAYNTVKGGFESVFESVIESSHHAYSRRATRSKRVALCIEAQSEEDEEDEED